MSNKNMIPAVAGIIMYSLTVMVSGQTIISGKNVSLSDECRKVADPSRHTFVITDRNLHSRADGVGKQQNRNMPGDASWENIGSTAITSDPVLPVPGAFNGDADALVSTGPQAPFVPGRGIFRRQWNPGQNNCLA